MLRLKRYNLQSFALGTKHVRAFSLDDCSGTIVDYVLAECGADKSPFPAEFYRRISSGEGAVKLQNTDDTASYAVTRDNIVITERTGSIDEELQNTGGIVKKGKHIIPGTLAFMNNPKAKFLGMMWQYAEKKTSGRDRFKHPVAEATCQRLLKLELKGNEFPSEANVRLAFRKKLSKSYLMRGQDDFLNIIVSVGDSAINDIWAETEDTKPRIQVVEDTRIGVVSIDVQIWFDPRRKISEKAIDAHWEECQRMKNRVAELLAGVEIETE
jgi:hypothetical protein